jgi:hypothetical protein
MTAAEAAKTAAVAVANLPATALTTGVDTVKAALDSILDVVTAGEKSADDLLTTLETAVPGIAAPLLQALHLAAKK